MGIFCFGFQGILGTCVSGILGFISSTLDTLLVVIKLDS